MACVRRIAPRQPRSKRHSCCQPSWRRARACAAGATPAAACAAAEAEATFAAHAPRRASPPAATARFSLRAGGGGVPQLAYSAPVSPPAAQQRALSVPASSANFVMFLLTFALGCGCGGMLAARRRAADLRGVTAQLAAINAALREREEELEGDEVVGEADEKGEKEKEGSSGVSGALKSSDVEAGTSAAGAKPASDLALALRGGKLALRAGEHGAALEAFSRAEGLARLAGELRAQRSALRGRALALQRAEDGREGEAVAALNACLALSLELGDHAPDADILGQMGDCLLSIGDVEGAADAYDRCLNRMNLP